MYYTYVCHKNHRSAANEVKKFSLGIPRISNGLQWIKWKVTEAFGKDALCLLNKIYPEKFNKQIIYFLLLDREWAATDSKGLTGGIKSDFKMLKYKFKCWNTDWNIEIQIQIFKTCSNIKKDILRYSRKNSITFQNIELHLRYNWLSSKHRAVLDAENCVWAGGYNAARKSGHIKLDCHLLNLWYTCCKTFQFVSFIETLTCLL